MLEDRAGQRGRTVRSELESLTRALEADPSDRALIQRLALAAARADVRVEGLGAEGWVERLVSAEFEAAQDALEVVVGLGPAALPALVSRAREQPLFTGPALAQLMPFAESYAVELLLSDDPPSREVGLSALVISRRCPDAVVAPLIDRVRRFERIDVEVVRRLCERNLAELRRQRPRVLALLEEGDAQRFDFALRFAPQLELTDAERWTLALAAARLAPSQDGFGTFRMIARLLKQPHDASPPRACAPAERILAGAAAMTVAPPRGFGPAPIFEGFVDAFVDRDAAALVDEAYEAYLGLREGAA